MEPSKNARSGKKKDQEKEKVDACFRWDLNQGSAE
jgi:hypothetical protein